MFKRKKKDEILSDHDAVQILDTIDKIIAGNRGHRPSGTAAS